MKRCKENLNRRQKSYRGRQRGNKHKNLKDTAYKDMASIDREALKDKAAATNTVLAWLGGGSVAASGGGMVAGKALFALAGPVGWTSKAHYLPLNDSIEFELKWERFYGELPAGTYRVVKEFMDFRDSGDYDTEIYYTEFEITE